MTTYHTDKYTKVYIQIACFVHYIWVFLVLDPALLLLSYTHITSAAVAKAAAARKTFVDTQVNLSELLYHSYTNIPPILYENCHSHTAYLRSITLSLAGNFNKTLSGVCETQ